MNQTIISDPGDEVEPIYKRDSFRNHSVVDGVDLIDLSSGQVTADDIIRMAKELDKNKVPQKPVVVALMSERDLYSFMRYGMTRGGKYFRLPRKIKNKLSKNKIPTFLRPSFEGYDVFTRKYSMPERITVNIGFKL